MKNAKTASDYAYLENVFEIPEPKWREMRSQYVEEDTYRGELVHYYLGTHPQASWNHLAGTLLYYDQNSALVKVEGKVKADKGRCAVDDIVREGRL